MPNVYFYKMRLFQVEQIHRPDEQDTVQHNYCPSEELAERIKRIIQARDQNNCIPIDDAPDWVVVEVLKYGRMEHFGDEAAPECLLPQADYVFGRIGKKKDITNVQMRNRNTNASSEIERGEGDDLEIHTYFYIFFDNAIVVYLGAQYAPGITRLNDMFSRFHLGQNLRTEVIPVTAEDMIHIIEHKDIVNSFELTVTLPSDEVLTIDRINLGEDVYDNLRDQVNTTLTVTFTAERRNSDVFREHRLIGQVIEHLNGLVNGRLDRFRFKAKNQGEKLQEYDIIEKKFTKNVLFRYRTEEGGLRRQEIENELFGIYRTNRTDIMRYCRD